MPKSVICVDAILFDMDGTLIDSTPGVLKAWETFAKDYNLGDPAAVAHSAHGRRLYDTLAEICGIDESNLQAEIMRFEEEVITGGPVALPGAVSLISQINANTPRQAWTIVTSATNYYTPRALRRCSIPFPSAGIVTSNDVSNGKPHPEPYLMGAQKTEVDISKCLVIEDAISGLKAGRAAGALVLATCTSTERSVILESGFQPDFIVEDLTRVSIKWVNDKMEVTMEVS